MKTTIFEYRDYKAFIVDFLNAKAGRGEKSRLAEALNCQLAYVSQVLNGNAHFSLEQGEAITRHFGLSGEESDFFISLLLFCRAGTLPLKNYYEKKMRQAVEKRLNLKHRLDFKQTISREDQATFYSAWYYAAIHLLIGIREFQTPETLCRYLKLPPKQIAKALNFLVSTGLAQKSGNRFIAGSANFHLPNDSPLISKHHANWRMQAIQSIDREETEDLHYSSVVTISKKDASLIKDALIEAIGKARSIITDSPEEDLFCLAMDFFSVGGG